ncbi:MAG TPA: cytochrome ubiquinol oxidase subunit I [Syntrophales bacterium]|nr:cytochrome ubiquinol oxidase subunit I [Syntrophales bacterium]HOM06386.1 cytochrome ubiquinol oxidase subunit I [Syntrophales bacterium]HON99163.1 cytochrome ubiquinol oxidase subunit I [Syntrophales bacterium]HPC00271.1 cytochrome ubiquinol oxidase subunit I [Syntrophales bacterium]HPQ05934.1 cytochrome ubiquinol oxidase subunit I [Syntrophales bacterium]
MDALTLSRIQFAVTAGFHFLFVPLTLGLAVLLAWMECRWVATGERVYLRLTRFWGRLFLINFVLGVVTGLTLEFQFGMNWASFSRFVGDVFGFPLAVEATAAFFLESVSIGLWVFGWDRVSPRIHALAMVVLAFAVNFSALWILLANGWMQNPVGHTVTAGRAELTDLGAFLANPYGWLKFLHTVFAGYIVAAFFVMAVSAWHLLRGSEVDLFQRSFRMAARFGLAASLLVVLVGDFHGSEVGKAQPAKLAAMESLWETGRGVPFYLIVIPDEGKEANALELFGIPKMVSFLAYKDFDAAVRGLRDFRREDRPPVTLSFLGFRSMVGLGFVFVLLTALAVWFSRRGAFKAPPLLLKAIVYALPLPYLACQLGWMVAEVGRQPWIVYGLMRTADAVSPGLTAREAALSLGGFTVLYGILALVGVYLLRKYAQAGPAEV